MSTNDDTNDNTLPSLKGETFDDACALAAPDKNATVFVNKSNPDTKKWGFCCSFKVGNYDEADLLEMIAAEWGPGEYPVQIRSVSGKGGGNVIRWQENMHVTARRRSGTMHQEQPAAAAPNSNDAIARALENQTQLLGAILDRVTTPPTPPPQPPNLMDFAKDLGVFKDLFVAPQKSATDTVREVLELTALIKDAGGGSDDPFAVAMKELTPKIVEGLDAMKKNDQRREAPAAARTAPNPPPKYERVDTDKAYSIFCENYLGPLLRATNQEPEAVARYIANMVGNNAEALHIIGCVVQEDDMIDRLRQRNERVAGHEHWLDEVADWLAFALWPDTNPAPTPENGTENGTSAETRGSQGINGASNESVEPTGNDPGPSTPSGSGDNDA